MVYKISEFVEVGLESKSPNWVLWRNRVYKITKVGLHHTYREGRILYHIFSVISSDIFFKLRFNTENLSWKIEEVANEF
jgi:hypothetical protein